jgi:hypothetical protein
MAELENCDLNDELENTHENFEFETHELSITVIHSATRVPSRTPRLRNNTGIRACLHAAFVGITHYANPERMQARHASVCLWMFRIDHA